MIMGFQEKRHQVDKGLDMEGKATWVIAGISLRSPLKPIYTGSPRSRGEWDDDGGCGCGGEEEELSTTPTGEEARIPAKFTCPPPAPRKRKPALKYRYDGVREFFNPPDLESVFMRKAERAN
ncbi:hypothetical protein ACJRO7_012580 [Eucalyptus globulus]|uniref:Uncharacterized protein n=1 Tax=Eucalyptus globulus TaxID=34317 RepID=A0ABD3LMH6_EUCGL